MWTLCTFFVYVRLLSGFIKFCCGRVPAFDISVGKIVLTGTKLDTILVAVSGA